MQLQQFGIQDTVEGKRRVLIYGCKKFRWFHLRSEEKMLLQSRETQMRAWVNIWSHSRQDMQRKWHISIEGYVKNTSKIKKS